MAGAAELLTYDDSGVLRAFRSTDGELPREIPLELPAISAMRVAPDAALLATFAPPTRALFDPLSGERIETISLKIKGVYGVAWGPGGEQIACSAADGRVRIWQLGEDFGTAR